MEAFVTLSIRLSSQVILPSSRASAGFGSMDFASIPRGRSKCRFSFFPAEVKLWMLIVTEDDGRAERKALPAPLFQAISPPVHVPHGLGQRAAAGLVQQGDPVREAQDLDRLVRGQIPSVNDSDLHLERVSRIHRGIAGQRRRIELGPQTPEDVLQASLDESFPNWAQAVRRR